MSCSAERTRKPFKDGHILRALSTIGDIDRELRKRPLGELTFADFDRLESVRARVREPQALLVDPA